MLRNIHYCSALKWIVFYIFHISSAIVTILNKCQYVWYFHVGIWSNSIKILFSLCEFLPFFTWWTEILFEDIYQTFILFKDGIVVIMHMNITLYMIIQLCWFATDKVDPGEKPPMESNLWHECTPITACCASNGNILTEHSFLIKQNWAWNLIFTASLEKK